MLLLFGSLGGSGQPRKDPVSGHSILGGRLARALVAEVCVFVKPWP